MQAIHKPKEKSRRDAEINTHFGSHLKYFFFNAGKKNEFTLVSGTIHIKNFKEDVVMYNNKLSFSFPLWIICFVKS